MKTRLCAFFYFPFHSSIPTLPKSYHRQHFYAYTAHNEHMSTSLTAIESQSNNDKRFIACNDKHCSTTYKYLDWVVHTKVDGPDPRDHFANERNFLSWLRVGMTLALIGNQINMLSKRPSLLTCAYNVSGYMTLIDLRGDKSLAPSNSLPWNHEEPTPYKTR